MERAGAWLLGLLWGHRLLRRLRALHLGGLDLLARSLGLHRCGLRCYRLLYRLWSLRPLSRSLLRLLCSGEPVCCSLEKSHHASYEVNNAFQSSVIVSVVMDPPAPSVIQRTDRFSSWLKEVTLGVFP